MRHTVIGFRFVLWLSSVFYWRIVLFVESMNNKLLKPRVTTNFWSFDTNACNIYTHYYTEFIKCYIKFTERMIGLNAGPDMGVAI